MPTITSERSNKALGFDFVEEPSDLDDDAFLAPPLPRLLAGQRVPGDYPGGQVFAGYPQMTRPPGVHTGHPISAVQTTQRWKTYRLLAHVFVTRDYTPTDMIGGIHPGNVVVAHDSKGYRIKIRLPTFGWYGTNDYYGEEFGWIDTRSSTGELLVMEMQSPLSPVMQGHGTLVVPPNEEVVYPTVRVVPALPLPIQTPPLPIQPSPLPVISGYEGAERTTQTPTLLLPKHDTYQHPVVYQPSTPKDLPVLLTPPKNTAVTPKATHVSAGAKVSLESAGGKKPPLLRKPLMPVPMVPPKVVATTSLDKKPTKRTAAVPGTAGTPTNMKKKNGSRRRRGVYRDKHQALVSHTPGVILYPRDPVTGHVIIPKHLVAAHRSTMRRKNRRPPCRSRRGPNAWKKQHGKAKA